MSLEVAKAILETRVKEERARRVRKWELLQTRFPELAQEMKRAKAAHPEWSAEIKLYEADGSEMK